MRTHRLLSRRVLVWVSLVALIGVLTTTAAVIAAQASQQRAAAEGLRRRADLTEQVVRGEMLRYEETLRTIAAAVSAQHDLTQRDFERITRPLLDARLGGAAGIAFLVPATTRETPSVQENWRRHDATGLTLQPTPGQARHVFLVFARSLDGRPMTLGRDVSSTPELAQTLRVVSSTGRVAVSEPYVLLKDRQLPPKERQLSLVLAAAVYDPSGQQQRGWVSMGLRGRDLLIRTLQQTGQDALNVSLTTTGPTGALTLADHISGPANDQSLIKQATIPIGQRAWTLTMRGTDAAAGRDTRQGELTSAILWGGASITLLVTGLVYLLSTSRARALRAVHLADAQLRQANDRFRFAFEHAHTGMAVIDLQPERLGQFQQVNAALCKMLGYSEQDLLHRGVLDLTHPEEVPHNRDLLRALGDRSQQSVQVEKRCLHANGQVVLVLLNAALIRDEDGRPAYAVAQLQDITALRAERQRMSAMALYDPLTGLGNRLLFQDHITQAAARTARNPQPLAVIYCDLDRFKEVNDTYGHAAGDAVLQTVAHRLRESVRPADTIARLGGDEFVVLCEDLDDPTAIDQILARIRAAVTMPIAISEHTTIMVGCSIGTATGFGPDLDVSTLQHQADLAMYQDKTSQATRR